MTTPDLERQWEAAVKQELRTTRSIILALAKARQRHPALWQAINAPRTEHRQQHFDFEQQDISVIDRQR